jgi:hypothetical protein
MSFTILASYYSVRCENSQSRQIACGLHCVSLIGLHAEFNCEFNWIACVRKFACVSEFKRIVSRREFICAEFICVRFCI